MSSSLNSSELTESSKMLLIDKIQNEQSLLNTYFIKQNLSVACILMLDGFHLYMFGPLLIPMKTYFDSKTTSTALIASSLFLGLFIGSFFSGILCDRFGRVKTANTAFIMTTILFGFMTLTDSFTVFIGLRVILGAFLGITVPINMALFAEILPTYVRGFFLVITDSYLSLSTAITLVQMIWVDPHFDSFPVKQGFRLILGIVTVLTFVNFFSMEDSPRNLILRGEQEKGFKILESVVDRPLSVEDKTRLVRELEETNTEDTDSIWVIFSKPYLRTTLLMLYINTSSSFICFGNSVISTQFLKKLQKNQGITSDLANLKQQLVDSGSTLVSNIISAIISEVPFFGRIYTMFAGISISVLLSLVGILWTEHFKLFDNISGLIGSVSGIMSQVYIAEIYPTKVRVKALGLFLCLGKLFGVLSQFFYLWLIDNVYFMYIYYINFAIKIVASIFTCMLSVESRNRSVDGNQMVEDEEEENKRLMVA